MLIRNSMPHHMFERCLWLDSVAHDRFGNLNGVRLKPVMWCHACVTEIYAQFLVAFAISGIHKKTVSNIWIHTSLEFIREQTVGWVWRSTAFNRTSFAFIFSRVWCFGGFPLRTLIAVVSIINCYCFSSARCFFLLVFLFVFKSNDENVCFYSLNKSLVSSFFIGFLYYSYRKFTLCENVRQ